MPKKTTQAASPMSKAAAIKEHLAKFPDAMPKEAAEELKKQGFEVDPQYVSVVKSQLKRDSEATGDKPAAPKKRVGKKRRRRGAKAAAASGAAALPLGGRKKVGRPPQVALSYESLKMAKELAAKLGGLEKAKQALDALRDLQG